MCYDKKTETHCTNCCTFLDCDVKDRLPHAQSPFLSPKSKDSQVKLIERTCDECSKYLDAAFEKAAKSFVDKAVAKTLQRRNTFPDLRSLVENSEPLETYAPDPIHRTPELSEEEIRDVVQEQPKVIACAPETSSDPWTWAVLLPPTQPPSSHSIMPRLGRPSQYPWPPSRCYSYQASAQYPNDKKSFEAIPNINLSRSVGEEGTELPALANHIDHFDYDEPSSSKSRPQAPAPAIKVNPPSPSPRLTTFPKPQTEGAVAAVKKSSESQAKTPSTTPKRKSSITALSATAAGFSPSTLPSPSPPKITILKRPSAAERKSSTTTLCATAPDFSPTPTPSSAPSRPLSIPTAPKAMRQARRCRCNYSTTLMCVCPPPNSPFASVSRYHPRQRAFAAHVSRPRAHSVVQAPIRRASYSHEEEPVPKQRQVFRDCSGKFSLGGRVGPR